MLTTALVAGGWIFWSIVAAVVIIDVLLLSSDDDASIGAVVLTTIATACLFLFTDAFVGISVATLILSLLCYVIVGVAWSMFKWYRFLVEQKASGRTSAPAASQFKSRILGWMVLWPFSFTWWVLSMPRRMFSWIYDQLSTLYDRIAQRVFS